jgi:hypothetical protein
MNNNSANITKHFGQAEPTRQEDVDANGNVIYEGYASLGTPTSQSGWLVTKHVYIPGNYPGVYIDIHDSTLQNVIWDARAAYVFP